MSKIKHHLDKINTELDQFMFDIEQATGSRNVMARYVSDSRRNQLRYHQSLVDDQQWIDSLQHTATD